jgi:hypothetical protein
MADDRERTNWRLYGPKYFVSRLPYEVSLGFPPKRRRTRNVSVGQPGIACLGATILDLLGVR